MSTKKQANAFSNPTWLSSAQLNIGPYAVGSVTTLLRAEIRGKVNFQAVALSALSVEANWLMFGLQWVLHGAAPLDVITSADGDHWLVRERIGDTGSAAAWAPSSDVFGYIKGYHMGADWAGQIPIGSIIDFYVSFNSAEGVVVPNYNTFGSIRSWWS